MSAPQPRSSRRTTDRVRTAAERASDAARASQARAARRRDRLVAVGVAVLEELLPPGPHPDTRAAVAEVEIDATLAISALVSMEMAISAMASLKAATAFSMPRLSSIGLDPAATFFNPSVTIM